MGAFRTTAVPSKSSPPPAQSVRACSYGVPTNVLIFLARVRPALPVRAAQQVGGCCSIQNAAISVSLQYETEPCPPHAQPKFTMMYDEVRNALDVFLADSSRVRIARTPNACNRSTANLPAQTQQPRRRQDPKTGATMNAKRPQPCRRNASLPVHPSSCSVFFSGLVSGAGDRSRNMCAGEIRFEPPNLLQA